MTKGRVALFLLIILSGLRAATGQLVSEEVCGKLVDLIATPLHPAHWYRNITFNDSCDFEFDIDVNGGVGASVELERFASDRDARRSFRDDRRMFEDAIMLYKDGVYLGFAPRSVAVAGAFWDQSAIYLDGEPLVMLRKNRTVITMFCRQQMLCERFENLLAAQPELFSFK